MPEKTAEYSYTVENHLIEFVVLLGKGFPKSPPRIFLKTVIGSPSYSDQRDFLGAILCEGEPWHIKMQLRTVVEQIPAFLSKTKYMNSTQSREVGNFDMEVTYPIQLMRVLWEEQLFYGFEHVEDRLVMYAFTVS